MTNADLVRLVDMYEKQREELTESIMSLAVFGQMDYASVAHMTLSERKILAKILQQKADAATGKKRPEML